MISFKSDDLFFWKEKKYWKRNTIRKVEKDDSRYIPLFNIYNNGPNNDYIEIVHSISHHIKFKRKIRDVSIWDGFFIISW